MSAYAVYRQTTCCSGVGRWFSAMGCGGGGAFSLSLEMNSGKHK